MKIEYEKDEKPKVNETKTSKKRASTEKVPLKSEIGPKTSPKTAKWEPANFRKTLKNIQEMRKEFPAPVDTMGCDVFQDDKTDPRICRFHCLFSLMLSSQTKDEVNFTVMQRLKKRFTDFSPASIIECSDTEFEELLKPVSFYKVM